MSIIPSGLTKFAFSLPSHYDLGLIKKNNKTFFFFPESHLFFKTTEKIKNSVFIITQRKPENHALVVTLA